ncbi:MAG: EamA family transporter [Sideroxydans sp.]|nr:EamA family transporter [Sideroxydans sp.]
MLGLLNAATVWGLVWYPYRLLAHAGVSGELATLLTYTIAVGCGLLVAGPVWRELRVAGWWGIALTLAAGWTNVGYVLAILDGEVMRVLLLFYLAPLWTVLLSRILLGERLNRYGYAIVALSLGGAFVMLWRPGFGLPLPQNRAEWTGLSAGVAFAVTNVLVRRVQHLSVNFKAIAILFGGALLTAMPLWYRGNVGMQVQAVVPTAWWLILAVALALCATSFAMQFGLTRLPANQAIVLLMFELVVAAISSYLLAGEEMGGREIAGALLIVAASLFSGKLHAQVEESDISRQGA